MNDDNLSITSSIASAIPSCYNTDYNSFLNAVNAIDTTTNYIYDSMGRFCYNTLTNTIEKNSDELKINIKKSQIKFNFNL